MCNEKKGTDEFRGENKTCNQCRDIENRKYAKHTYICPLCKFEIKTKRKATHEKSLGHQYYLQQFNKNEAPRKPDKIDTTGGITSYYCFACKCATSPNSWGAHCMSHID